MVSSYQTFSYLNYPFEEVLERLARFGYKGVEVSAASECGTFYPSLLTEERIKKVVEKAKSLGLEIVSYDCELLPANGWNIASPYTEVREKTVNYINSAILVANQMGAKVVVVVAGRALYGVDKKQAWDWAVQGFKKCSKFAEDYGIYLVLEHLTLLEGNIAVTLGDLLSMIKEVDSKNFAALLDTGHVNVTGESLTDYVLQLGDKLKHIHIDDNDGKSDDHLPPGMGNINFAPLFIALKKINYQGAISVEPGFGSSTDPDSAAQIGISFLQKYLQ